jgi:uncharacterized protein YegP (UPF0339 family)
MKVEIYKDASKEWRMRLKGRNGRIILASSEGYKRKSTLLRIQRQAREIQIIEVKDE